MSCTSSTAHGITKHFCFRTVKFVPRMTKTVWHLSVLREHIDTLPREAWQRPVEILESINRSLSIFLYHLYKARDAIEGIFNEAEPASIENVRLVFGGVGEKATN